MPSVRLRDRDVDQLPMVCLKCGEPADLEKNKNFSWCPQWVSVLILAGLLPYLIVVAILTKRMSVRAPLCVRHKNHWLWRAWFMWGGLAVLMVVGIGAVVIMANTDQRRGGANEAIAGFACVGAILLGLVWLIAAMAVQYSGIRPKEITDRTITLIGVSEHFIDALEEQDRQAQAGRRHRPQAGIPPDDRDFGRDEDRYYER